MYQVAESTVRDQRLTMRVLAHWRTFADGRTFPRRSQIDAQRLGADWSNCFMIELDPVLDRSRFGYVGESLRDPAWPTFERQYIADCLENTLLQLATSYVERVIARRMVVSVGGTGIHLGTPIIYRSVLLPLSENDERIDGILGAANFREIPGGESIHESHELAVVLPSRDH